MNTNYPQSNGNVGWSDAGILIPHRFYKLFGGKSILEEYYDRMKKYFVTAGQSYGEYVPPRLK